MKLRNVVAVDGIDGCGKTYQVNAVAKKLKELGVNVKSYRYPTDDFLGPKIRELLSTVEFTAKGIQLLFEADKHLADATLKSFSEDYDLVLLDRHNVVNLAYGIANGLDFKWISSLQRGYSKGTTLYIDVPPTIGVERRKQAGIIASVYDKDIEFLDRARRAFWGLVSISNRIVGEDEPEKVTGSILAWLRSNKFIRV